MNVNEIGNRVYNGAAATGNAIINMSKQGVEWGGKAVTLIRENGSAGVQKVLRFIGSAWKAISSFFITHKDGLFTAVQNNRYALGLCGVLVAGIAIGALGAREYSRRYPTTPSTAEEVATGSREASPARADEASHAQRSPTRVGGAAHDGGGQETTAVKASHAQRSAAHDGGRQQTAEA